MTTIKNRTSISQGNKYYDDLAKVGYTEARDYQQVLFKPGKVLQSRELNFLQSLLHEKLKARNDIEFKNGSIIMGCDITFDTSDLRNATATVGDGIVYWDGSFIKFFSKTSHAFDISSTSAKVITVYLVPVYETIDYTVDTNLYDPAIIYKINKSVTGADRLKLTFTVQLSDDPETFEDTNRQCFKIGTFVISTGEIILNNRDPFLFEQEAPGETKVIQGLRVRPNPMREVYSINDGTDSDVNNNYVYNGEIKKTFIEVEEGTAIIKNKQVINTFSRVFTFDKSLSDTNDNVITTQELKEADFKDIDTCGIYGDIAYGSKYIDRKTFMFDMLQPGKTVKIMMRVPLQRSLKSDPTVVTTQMETFEVCTASIADVYDLWRISFQKKIPQLIDNDKIFDTSVLNELSSIDLTGTRLYDRTGSSSPDGSSVGTPSSANDSSLLFKKSSKSPVITSPDVIGPDPDTNTFIVQLISAFSEQDSYGYRNWIVVVGGIYGYDGSGNLCKISNTDTGLMLDTTGWTQYSNGSTSEFGWQFGARTDLDFDDFDPLSSKFFVCKPSNKNNNMRFTFSMQGKTYTALAANPFLYKYNDDYYSGVISVRHNTLSKAINIASTISMYNRNNTYGEASIDSNVSYSGFCLWNIGLKTYGNNWAKDSNLLYDGTYYKKIVDTLNGITNDSGQDAWKQYVLFHERIKKTY